MKERKIGITAPLLMAILAISANSVMAQLPKPSASARENDDVIREMLAKGKTDDALLFVDDCLKMGPDREFYLECKLQLLRIAKRNDEAIACALLLDGTSATKKAGPALRLAELYLDAGNKDEALIWLREAADRGIKDFRLLGDGKWDVLKRDPGYGKIHKRIMDNQGIGGPIRDFTVKLVDGDDLRISRLKGKVVLIDFWATWCAPCTATIPELKRIYDKLHPRGFEVVGISLDRDIDALKDYMRENDIRWYVSFSGQPWAHDRTAELYGVGMIPATFLVDKAGRLRHYNIPSAEWEKAVQALLDEK